jgi:hypothetical protein
MPDIWTKHPEIVRDLLKAGGLKCGVEPRIVKDKDPSMTCVVDGENLWGDIYINHVKELTAEPARPEPLPSRPSGVGWEIFGAVTGVLLVLVGIQAWTIRRLKRAA